MIYISSPKKFTLTDADFDAVINYATTNGYTLPTKSKLLLLLISRLKQIGVWQKLDVFYVFSGDGDSDFKCINLIDPAAFFGTKSGGLTWSNLGVKGNGTDGYIDSGYTPSINAVERKLENAGTFGVMANVGDVLWGTNSADDRFQNVLSANTKRLDGPFTTVVSATAAGFVGIMRDSGTTGRFISKSDVTNISGSTNDLTARVNLLLRSGMLYGTTQLSCWGTGAALTETEVLNFRNAFNNYLIKIGESPIA